MLPGLVRTQDDENWAGIAGEAQRMLIDKKRIDDMLTRMKIRAEAMNSVATVSTMKREVKDNTPAMVNELEMLKTELARGYERTANIMRFLANIQRDLRQQAEDPCSGDDRSLDKQKERLGSTSSSKRGRDGKEVTHDGAFSQGVKPKKQKTRTAVKMAALTPRAAAQSVTAKQVTISRKTTQAVATPQASTTQERTTPRATTQVKEGQLSNQAANRALPHSATDAATRLNKRKGDKKETCSRGDAIRVIIEKGTYAQAWKTLKNTVDVNDLDTEIRGCKESKKGELILQLGPTKEDR